MNRFTNKTQNHRSLLDRYSRIYLYKQYLSVVSNLKLVRSTVAILSVLILFCSIMLGGTIVEKQKYTITNSTQEDVKVLGAFSQNIGLDDIEQDKLNLVSKVSPSFLILSSRLNECSDNCYYNQLAVAVGENATLLTKNNSLLFDDNRTNKLYDLEGKELNFEKLESAGEVAVIRTDNLKLVGLKIADNLEEYKEINLSLSTDTTQLNIVLNNLNEIISIGQKSKPDLMRFLNYTANTSTENKAFTLMNLGQLAINENNKTALNTALSISRDCACGSIANQGYFTNLINKLKNFDTDNKINELDRQLIVLILAISFMLTALFYLVIKHNDEFGKSILISSKLSSRDMEGR